MVCVLTICLLLRILKGPLGKYYQAGPIARDEDA